jgi:hypothetical protein
MGDVVLEGITTVLVAKALEEDFDVVRRQRLKSCRALIELELIKKPGDGSEMGANGRWRKSANVFQEGLIVGQLLISWAR